MCLTLNSLGIQTCAEETRSAWQVSDCSSPDTEVRIHPFGWYQKPGKCAHDLSVFCTLKLIICLQCIEAPTFRWRTNLEGSQIGKCMQGKGEI